LAVYTGDSLTNLTVIGSQDRGQSNESITFDSRAGQTFAIAIDGYNGATGSATLNLDFTPAPINDDFTNRIVLTNLPVSVTTSNIAATLEAGETNVVAGWSAGASLWWSWTAPVAGRLRLTDEGTTYDALLALVTGSSITNLTTVAEQDRSPFEDLSAHVQGGTTYAIGVYGYRAAEGVTTLNLSFVPSPVNDDFANRTRLVGSDISLTASNVAATVEVGEPAHAGKPGGKSVWWGWTPAAGGTTIISTVGSSLDTVLAVYTGANLTNLTVVAGSDLTLGDSVTFVAVKGVEYLIAVDGYNGGEGVFPLTLKQSPNTPLGSSTFDTDGDFWTAVSLADVGPFTNILGGPWIPTFVSTNGNPGGYLSQSDPDGNTWFWNAPTKLLGDQSLAYGGVLKYDLRQSATDSQYPSADVVLTGGGLTVVFRGTNSPGTNWTSFAVPLVSDAWTIDQTSIAPTPSQLQAVLTSLTALLIRGEYRNGFDVGDLDNVAWVANVPISDVLFNNENIDAVQNGPTQPTTFVIANPAVITYVEDYHYFNNGAAPGTISLRHDDGTIYGPWVTRGATGQGGVLNATWITEPMAAVKAGRYTVQDSDPATWSHNAGSGFAGFSLVKGYFIAVEPPLLEIAQAADGGVAISWPASATGFTLESRASLGSPGDWLSAGATPILEGDRLIVRSAAPANAQFYRLRQ